MPSATTSLTTPEPTAVARTAAAGQSNDATRAYGWLITALLLLFVANIFVFATRPAVDGSYAVIVPPHLGQAALMETLAAANGTLVRESRYPWLAIVSPADASTQANFASALRQAGALLLLHPAVLAGCFSPDLHAAGPAGRPASPTPLLNL